MSWMASSRKYLVTASRSLWVRPLTRAATVLALLGAASGAVVLEPWANNKDAHASASGCTQLGSSPTDRVCIHVEGSGRRVNKARASFIAPVSRPCNTRLTITFFDLNNTQVKQYSSDVAGECQANDEIVITPRQNFPQGRVCGAVWINGVAKPGACVSLIP